MEFTVTGTVARIVTTVGLSKADRPPLRGPKTACDDPAGGASRRAVSSTVERIAALTDCDGRVFGHTYKPWVQDCGVLSVSCGFVGKPQDGAPRACFALLEANVDGVTTSLERTAYDAVAVAREMQSVGLPDELADKLVAAA